MWLLSFTSGFHLRVKGGRGAGPQWPLEVFALTVRALIKGQGGDGARWGRFGK